MDSLFNHSCQTLTFLTLACHKFIMLAPSYSFFWRSATFNTSPFPDSVLAHPQTVNTSVFDTCMYAFFWNFLRICATLNTSPFPYSMYTQSSALLTTMSLLAMQALFLRFRSGVSTINTSPFPDSVLAYTKAFNTSAFLASVYAKRGLFLFNDRVANTAFNQIMWAFLHRFPLNCMSETFNATCLCLLAMWTFPPDIIFFDDWSNHTLVCTCICDANEAKRCIILFQHRHEACLHSRAVRAYRSKNIQVSLLLKNVF